MVSLATATLQALGVGNPKRHLFMASSGSVATLVMSRSPLSDESLDGLRKVASTYDFPVLLDPQAPSASALLESIVSARDGHTLELVRPRPPIWT